MTAAAAGKSCEPPEQVVLQSLLRELSFCESTTTIDYQEEEEIIRTAASSVLTRSKMGLIRSNSSCKDADRDEPSCLERRNSGESSDSLSSDSSPSLARTVWRAAVDPVSGRTYYYDSISRITQWEKVSAEADGLEARRFTGLYVLTLFLFTCSPMKLDVSSAVNAGSKRRSCSDSFARWRTISETPWIVAK